MKKAKITYYLDWEGKEGYLIESTTDGKFGIDSFFPLVFRKGASENEERNFVYFGIINKIRELQEYGYKISFH